MKFSEIGSILNVISRTSRAFNFGTDLSTKDKYYEELAAVTKKLSDKNTILYLSQQRLDREQIKNILRVKGITSAQAEEALAKYATATATGVLTKSQTLLATVTTTLKNAMGGLFATLKAHPIFLIIGAVALAKSIYDKFNVTLKEHKEKVEDSKDKYNETISNLESLESQLQSVKEKIETLHK